MNLLRSIAPFLVLFVWIDAAEAQSAHTDGVATAQPARSAGAAAYDHLRKHWTEDLQARRRFPSELRPQGVAIPAAVPINKTDSLALVALYHSTGGPGWTNDDNWLETDVVNWYGITVAGDRVTGISLSANRLIGTIPPEIGDLTALRSLDLNDFFEESNVLSGEIPSEIGKLTDLSLLYLDGNRLTGSIPSGIQNLSRLENLSLASNLLTGEIPDWLGDLSSLDQLWLFDNRFEGPIPDALGKLSALTELDLGSIVGGNNLTGPFPDALRSLTNLVVLGLAQNQLDGPIPAWLGELTNLSYLSLHGNRFDGSLPVELGNLRNMLLLDVGIKAELVGEDTGERLLLDFGNRLSGPIPDEIGNLTQLRGLWLSNNAFMGAVPSSFDGLTLLRSLLLNCNRLEDLPAFTNMPDLALLSVEGNRLTFEDLEPIANASLLQFIYAPQASVPLTVTNSGPGIVLSVEVAGLNNRYQWFLDGSPIGGASGPVHMPPAGAPSDASRYHVEITNSTVPELSLTTRGRFEEVVVNRSGDESDADPADGTCDVDSDTPGSQCTLRAALELAAGGGIGRCGRDIRIVFDGVFAIHPRSALPAINALLEIDGGTTDVELRGTSAGAADGLLVTGGQVAIRRLAITGFSRYGVRMTGGGGHTITGSRIEMPESGTPGTSGAIRVENGVTGVTIGGLEGAASNRLFGGISVVGSGTRSIGVLRNSIEIPAAWVSGDALRVPLDLADDGPTCTSWSEDVPDAPNRAVGPPRILELTATGARGLTRPGATVIAYGVAAEGSARGRYWARSVVHYGHAVADASGAFVITFDDPLPAGARLTFGMVDAFGNASELAQVRRPVVYLPGVGGTWLSDPDGTPLFISFGRPRWVVRNRLDRLAMNADGRTGVGGQVVVTDGILEQPQFPYRAVLQHLQDAGFTGRPGNTEPAILDLWRFEYDWRLSSFELADDLRDRIDAVTGLNSPQAAACEVDVVTHSNGGMVASAYVWKHRDHSRNRVHRLLMSAAPYLGSAQVAAAHTVGYLFDIEKIPYVGPSLHWGRMTRTFLNLPNGYGLLPSRAYFDAINSVAPGQTNYYLTDLHGKALRSYDETVAFMIAPKTDARGTPVGLGRNGVIWQQQQSGLHDLMNDWRTYEGPPQIFRHVGRVNDTTNLIWRSPLDLSEGDRPWFSSRVEEGDEDLHVAYREALKGFTGWGDGTVPLFSATLGRGTTTEGMRVGVLDFSGVDESPWIEEFEYFPCLHVPMVGAECSTNEITALDRTVETLLSGYEVSERSVGKKTDLHAGIDPSTREVVDISASAPIAVFVVDNFGRETGPVSPDSLDQIAYGVPDIVYTASIRGAVISLPADRAYDLRMMAVNGPALVRVERRSASGDTGVNMLFEDRTIADGGILRLAFEEGGTAASATLDVDADGDGAFEGAFAPALEIESAEAGPGAPQPQPVRLQADVLLGTEDPTFDVELDGGSDAEWRWAAVHDADWIVLNQSAGQVPATIAVTLAASALQPGLYRDVVAIEVTLDGFTRRQPIPVELAVRDRAAALASIEIRPGDAVLMPGDSLRFWALGRDQLEQPIRFTPGWSATGGTIDPEGLLVAGSEAGVFRVTATSVDGAVTASVDVTIGSAVAIDSDRPPPVSFDLAQNYPNPFNPMTRIRFDLPQAARVRLVVYDLLGRRVAVAIDETLPAGRYVHRFDAADLASGVYLYRLEAGAFIRTRAMHVLK